MTFRITAVFSALMVALLAGRAQAQFGVYGMVTGERVTSIKCIDPTGVCAATSGTARPYGGTFGVQYDFKTYGPVTLGGDFRGAVLNSNKRADTFSGSANITRHYEALGGVRAVFATPFKILRPYAQVSAGLGRANVDSTNPAMYQNHGQVEGFAGLDLALFPSVDIRAIEFGAGEMFGSGSHGIQQVGLGIVFHLPR